VVPIPGTTRAANLDENIGALDIELSTADLATIEAAFPRDAAGPRYATAATASLETPARAS
jgi:aryl-alcohol dehydrogenase-like predicted oxidoreductase